MATQLDLAKAQVIGFYHAKRGYSLQSLIQDMGLKRQEWEKIKETEKIPEADKEDIDLYFKRKSLQR